NREMMVVPRGYDMLAPLMSVPTARRTVVVNFEQLLKFGVDQGASAIYLQAQNSPQLRMGGRVRNVERAPLKADELSAFIASIAPKSVVADLDRALAQGSTFSTS